MLLGGPVRHRRCAAFAAVREIVRDVKVKLCYKTFDYVAEPKSTAEDPDKVCEAPDSFVISATCLVLL